MRQQKFFRTDYRFVENVQHSRREKKRKVENGANWEETKIVPIYDSDLLLLSSPYAIML